VDLSLLDIGGLWIEENFVPDSQPLFASLAETIAWDDRLRARKAASFGLPYNYSGITYQATPFPDAFLPPPPPRVTIAAR
jgi:hypothetical protein